MIYAIHEELYAGVEKKLNRIANKCSKFGNDFIFEVVGDEIREKKSGSITEYHKFILVDVEGVAHVDNWEFIATLDIHEDGNIIRRFNNEIKLPERFKNSEDICEHCNSKRNRKRLYVVHNTDTDEFKQVGGNCLSIYTHGLDMELVAAWIDGITELQNNNDCFYENATPYYSIEDVLHYANIIINKVGYFKSDDYNVSTKELVSDMLRRDVFASTIGKRVELLNKTLANHGFGVSFTTSDFCVDDAEEVNNIMQYYNSCDDNGEFIHNIKIMLNERYIPYKYIGLVCYLPQGYAKHIEREIERAERKKLNRIHFGEIKKRYKNVPVKNVEHVAAYETMYGIMNVYNIVIEGDIVITWKTSNYIDDNPVSISFTVKDHGEYKGVPQTEVTRCNITYTDNKVA